MSDKKENGAYYTPGYLAEYIVNEIFSEYSFYKNKMKMLEPSSGDGIFIKSLLKSTLIPQDVTLQIDVVEKNKEELEKVKLHKLTRDNSELNYFATDFLNYNSSGNKYDLIIGNPPYINKKLLSEEQIDSSISIFSEHQLNPRGFNNIWMSFILKSMFMLEQNGTLCFVLPSELLQVNYSSELRRYLFDNFSEIKIFLFNELVFEKIQQDVIIFIASKKGVSKSVNYYEIDDLSVIRNKVKLIPYSIVDYNSQKKWSNYLLSRSELKLIDTVANSFNKVSDYCTATAGIVTAANDYFIVNKQNQLKYNLSDISFPILKKSSYLEKGINLTVDHITSLEKRGHPIYLLIFNKKNIHDYQGQLRKYLEVGLKKEIHLRYKSKNRFPWFKVPYLEAPEGIFFKRSHLYPKIIVNSANVLTTDNGYRITMKEGYRIHSLVFSFYNSFTLLMSELEGRYYGGGVLELTPNEFKRLPLPYCEIGEEEFTHLDNLFKEGRSIEEILDYTDNIILMQHYGVGNDELIYIRNLRNKLMRRRLKEINHVLQAL
ncbi:Eco57I restriction-modification methylase domain-containing protein [Bacillus sp. B-jedd]|uniref:Eco57I restriction-modification methylase domain-containing protein n=1 Tax=Bacillus sp. B-jedd TaxID=1476857 RepID=UPI000515709B|nr:N-6 DNA methylase [Bacillus sp. B-jedd]CEG25311.1 N-6 DNA methylase [Bacillus sp. B-jedd]